MGREKSKLDGLRFGTARDNRLENRAPEFSSTNASESGGRKAENLVVEDQLSLPIGKPCYLLLMHTYLLLSREEPVHGALPGPTRKVSIALAKLFRHIIVAQDSSICNQYICRVSTPHHVGKSPLRQPESHDGRRRESKCFTRSCPRAKLGGRCKHVDLEIHHD